jgi:hypothetical protein
MAKIIRNFLTSEELDELRKIATSCFHHEGTRPGIYKVGTISGGLQQISEPLYQKFLNASGLPLPFNGSSIHQFISYQTNGFIHPHKDWVYDTSFTHQLRKLPDEKYPACKLYRVNVLIDATIRGGECFVDGVEVPKLNEGDAIVLRAELQEHEVKPILEGKRMIFTIGFHHNEGTTK